MAGVPARTSSPALAWSRLPAMEVDFSLILKSEPLSSCLHGRSTGYLGLRCMAPSRFPALGEDIAFRGQKELRPM